MNTPTPTELKQIPEENLETPAAPRKTKQKRTKPDITPAAEETPIETNKLEETPEESPELEDTPEQSPEKTDMPADGIPENCVVVDGQTIEIKPTKLKYFRNKGASGYGLIKAVPIHEFFTYGKGILDEKRDSDQLMYDFLVAVFNDSAFVRDHYDEFDADTVDRVCKIFGRINHIDEREEAARKNREAQAQATR